MIHTTLFRPRSNGKIEQIIGVLKSILSRAILDNRKLTFATALARAVHIFSRGFSPLGYSPFFFLYGTKPPEEKL